MEQNAAKALEISDYAYVLELGQNRYEGMRRTKKPGWGIVVLASELINQRGEVVQRGEHRLMIPRRPASVTVSGGRPA